MTESHDYPRTQPDGEHLVYETQWWDFYYDDTIRSNGSPGKYSWAKLHSGNGGALVLPVTPSGRCLMIRVYRYPVKRYMWEFPAGMIEDGETPEEAGRRELLEETGIASDEAVLIGSQTPMSGFVNETLYTVLAQIPEINASDVKPQFEEGIVEAKLVTRQELTAMAASPDIEDGVTLMCLARYWAYLDQHRTED